MLQKESQSFKGARAKWLILCTLMPCFSRVRFLIENAQPFLLVCCLASAVKEPRTDIIFPSLETLLCCLIWVTIFLWCSTSHKHSPLCTSLLCGMELGQKLLQCSACRPWTSCELMFEAQKFVVFAIYTLCLPSVHIVFHLQKNSIKACVTVLQVSSFKVAWAIVAVSWKASFYEKWVMYRYWHSILCLTLLAGILVHLE